MIDHDGRSLLPRGHRPAFGEALFKELLSTFFVEFLELFLPEVLDYLEPESLVFLDKELFTDVTAGERKEADLLVKAQFQEQESFFLVHLENQSQPQSDFGRQMFRSATDMNSYFAR